MTFEALQRTVDEALAAARDHARALDRIATEPTETPARRALTDHFGGRPSDQPS